MVSFVRFPSSALPISRDTFCGRLAILYGDFRSLGDSFSVHMTVVLDDYLGISLVSTFWTHWALLAASGSQLAGSMTGYCGCSFYPPVECKYWPMSVCLRRMEGLIDIPIHMAGVKNMYPITYQNFHSPFGVPAHSTNGSIYIYDGLTHICVKEPSECFWHR